MWKWLGLFLALTVSAATAAEVDTITVPDINGTPREVPTLLSVEAYVDQLEGYLDGVEGFVDGVEGTLTTISGNIASALTALQLIDDTVFTDDAAFTPATSKLLAIGFQADETAPDSVTEGDIGTPRMLLNRWIMGVICDGDGNERCADVNASEQLVTSCADCVGGGTVDSAAPTAVIMQGYRANGSSAAGTLDAQPVIGCTDTAVINIASSGNNEIVSLTASETIYVCRIFLIATTAVSVQYITGTGTACATGETDRSGLIPLAALAGFTDGGDIYSGLKSIVSNAFCIELSGAVQVSGIMYYTKG